jgi:hypothetical protein
MKTLRRLHLYLGCFFAPLILFFAISGTWQVSFAHHPTSGGEPSPRLALLSTLHTGRGLKVAETPTLSSQPMRYFVTAMAVALVVTVGLGVIMAFRFGHGWVTLGCLLGGIAVPGALIVRQLSTG